MSEKSYEQTWLPADWMDECIPATLRHPTDFIHRCDDGSYIVIPKESKDDLRPEGGIEDQGHLLFKIAAGDMVRFQPTEQYGTFTLHLAEDQSFWIDGDYPSKANCFYHNDLETLGGSLNELIETGDGINGPLEPGCYSVAVYWWGDDVAFRFEVKADGAAHFVRSGEVH
ncbi:hypothetical protein IB024_00110 [Brucella sp. 6810]|uniref:hypothetical protein n=1 Tax=Brucella sp. 6810 TaxID=2769351 RepID=UPI00165AABB3|nr:hypothetical protein [Brucella sp. 6810]QNQ62208.1 hypothetical protein IB024_00110 [Brucella sp. 6810]